jgi:hypothetical protein
MTTYDVQLVGELVRRVDAQNSLLPEAMKQRHNILVARQRVKGIRFTVRCPDALLSALGTTWYGISCSKPLVFWRSNALSSRSLGVDVRQMERAEAA